MSKKTLNKVNLAALGADRLADLLLEVSTGSADIKRRLRLELSHNLGAAELAHEVRKRLASLRKSKSYVSWRKRKALVTDLNTQVSMIVDKIAPDDPETAFDLLWQFIDLAPSIYDRADDRRGDIGEVFRGAIVYFEEIAPRASLDPKSLSDRVWSAISDNTYGEWDTLIDRLAPALGTLGLDHLKGHIETFSNAPAQGDDPDHEALQFLRDLRDGRDYRAEQRQKFAQQCLQEIAQAQGDTSAYIAQFSADDLSRKSVAAEVATLMLDNDQPDQALAVLTGADGTARTKDQDAWDAAYIATLTTLGRDADAQDHRWACFEQRLSLPQLKEYLKRLPDFDDIEAEERAKSYVLSYPHIMPAVQFSIAWPDLHLASQLIIARVNEIDGERYEVITPAAEVLYDRHPLAATLLLRSMIDFALFHGRASRYVHIANHLRDCATLAEQITDFAGYADHETYAAGLRDAHGHKASFWSK